MGTLGKEPFEFDDLDQLWDHVKDLKSSVHQQVRNPKIAAQGVINELQDDARFKNRFTWYAARQTRAFDRTDMHLFTIYKNPKRI